MMKRAFDILAASVGLLCVAPFLLLAALVIKLSSKGPAVFKQTRMGLNQREFTCFKLRTMYIDTADLPSHLVGKSSITPLGACLRKTKLDELPQLWNILCGQMSFVGPRPCLPTQTELVERREALGLFKIRPGITGVSQVKGINMSDPEKLALSDATYLKNMSLGTDLKLIFGTVLGAGRGDAAS